MSQDIGREGIAIEKDITDRNDLTDELLWEKWCVQDQDDALFELLDRFKWQLIHYARKMLAGSFSPDQAMDYAYDFYFWCYSAPQFHRRLMKYNPEVGTKVRTYLAFIIRSCWSIFFKYHLREILLEKHVGSEDFGKGGDTEYKGLLQRTPDETKNQEKSLIDKDAVRKISQAAQSLNGREAYIFESIHLVALGGKYGKNSAQFVTGIINHDLEHHIKTVMSFHQDHAMNELRSFLAKNLGISNNNLHVIVFRTNKKVRELLENEKK